MGAEMTVNQVIDPSAQREGEGRRARRVGETAPRVVSSSVSDAGARAPSDEEQELLRRSVQVAVGLAIGVVAVAAGALRRSSAPDQTSLSGGEPALVPLAAGAMLGAATAAGTAAVWGVRAGWTVVRWGAGLLPTSGAQAVARRAAIGWNARWEATSQRSRHAATAFVVELAPEVVEAVLDQLDLTTLIRDRVDLDALLAQLDIDAIAASIDVDRVVERIDVDAIAHRIDVDAIVERLDLERIVRRIDLATIVGEVFQELDLLTLIRDSSEGVASEAVDDLRLGAADADRAVARAIDRVFRRRSPRNVPMLDAAQPR
jgi:hypothetical protein